MLSWTDIALRSTVLIILGPTGKILTVAKAYIFFSLFVYFFIFYFSFEVCHWTHDQLLHQHQISLLFINFIILSHTIK